MSKTKALEMLRHDIAMSLADIEEACESRGLTTMNQLTLLARDPTNDEMSIVVSSEPENRDDIMRVIAKRLS